MNPKFFAALITACLLPGMSLAEPPRVEGQGRVVNARAFPELTRIYRFTGVRTTSTSSNTGIQLSVHCTNWHPNLGTEVRYILRNFTGATEADRTFLIGARDTATVSSAGTIFYQEFGNLSPTVPLDQGSLEIQATRPSVHCTAQLVDAANSPPTFIVELPPTRSAQEGDASGAVVQE